MSGRRTRSIARIEEPRRRELLAPRSRPWLALAAGALVVAALAGCAAQDAVPTAGATTAAAGVPTDAATAPSVSAVDIAKGEFAGALGVSVDDPDGVQVVFREITIQPGASTGKHCHDGQLIGVVKQGDLTHYAPIYPSGVHVYHAGDAIVEGPGYVHEGRNEGTVPVILDVTYLIRNGDPLAETDLSKCEAG